MREALTQVFDFEWMNKNLFYGTYTRTGSYFSNSEFASSGVPSGPELALLGTVPRQAAAGPVRQAVHACR